MMRHLTRHSLWSVLVTLLSVAVIAAQGASCTGLLEDALFAVEDNCDGTGRNQVCYGYNQVSASFVNDVSDDFFTQPADLSEVADLATLQTAPLDVTNDIWGVALMNIQANLPNTLPGQSVTFVLLGDVEVGNTVDPENTFEPSDGLEVIVTSPAGANIRSGAGLNFNVLGGARPEEVLLADGTSADGQWLRIAYNERIAWISRTVIDDTVDGLDDLPILSNDLQTPMQSFYLRTGIGQPECEDVPDDVLLVQGPENIEVTINVNGADIRIGSTIALRFVQGEDGQIYMQAIAISGRIEVDGVTLLPGQFTQFVVGEDANGLPIAMGDPSPPAPFEGYVEEYCLLEQLPLSLLNYQITSTCTNPLTVPVITGGGTSITSTQSQVDGASCDTFALLSPLSPVNSGNQTFRWTAVQGDNIDYVVVFYNNDGIETNQFRTSDTQLTLNLGAETSTGGAFTWEVRAYQNTSDYACVTFRSPNLVRTGELNPEAPQPVIVEALSASLTSCVDVSSIREATISWNSASTGSVTISWVDGYSGSGSATFSGESGTTTISDYSGYSSIVVTSGADVVNLGECMPYYGGL